MFRLFQLGCKSPIICWFKRCHYYH